MSGTSGLPSWVSFLSSSLDQKSLRFGVVGASGSGKTSIVSEFLRFHRFHARRTYLKIFIFDPHDEFHGTLVRTSRQFLKLARQRIVTIRVQSPTLWDEILPAILKGGHCLCVVDEAQRIFPRAAMTDDCFKLITEGRHNRIGLMWATQRPTSCSTHLLGNTAGVMVGRLMAPADHQWARSWGITTMVPVHEFHCVFPGQEPYAVQSKPIK